MTTPAVHVPALEPVPVEGCPICATAGRQRKAARETGSVISVKACGVTISQHPHRKDPAEATA